MTSYEMALEFHQALGLPIGSGMPDEALRRRLTLIGEEVGELVAAMCGYGDPQARMLSDYLVGCFRRYAENARTPDLAEVAKEIVDVHVVTSGAAVEYGIPEDDVYAVVHRSNLAKAGGPRRADGKVLKPEGWQAPDVARVLVKLA